MQNDSSPVQPTSPEQKKPKKKRRGCAIAAGIFFVFFVLPAMCSTPKEKGEKTAAAEQAAAPSTPAPAETPAEAPTARPAEQPAVDTHTTAETPSTPPTASSAQQPATDTHATAETPAEAAQDDSESIWDPVDPAEKKLNKLTDEEIEAFFKPSVEAIRRESEVIEAAVAHAEKITNRATADKYASVIAEDVQLMQEALRKRFLQPVYDADAMAKKLGISEDDAEAAIEEGGFLFNRLPKEVRNANAIWEFEHDRWAKQLNRLHSKKHFDSVKLFSAVQD